VDGCKEICQRQTEMEKARLPMFQQELEEQSAKVRYLGGGGEYAPNAPLAYGPVRVTGSTGSPVRWIPGSLGRWVTKCDPVPRLVPIGLQTSTAKHPADARDNVGFATSVRACK